MYLLDGYDHAEWPGKRIRYIWLPSTNLSNPAILNPLAYPLQTTEYELLVYDTLGCPKPGISKVIVNVNPQIIAFAGNDTSIVVNQPLQTAWFRCTFFFMVS